VGLAIDADGEVHPRRLASGEGTAKRGGLVLRRAHGRGVDDPILQAQSSRPDKGITSRRMSFRLGCRPAAINVGHYHLCPSNPVRYRTDSCRHPRTAFILSQLPSGKNTGGDQQHSLPSFFHLRMIYFRYIFAICHWRGNSVGEDRSEIT
jgi:hypothetical protein